MDREKSIMKRLQEHYDELVKMGYEIVFLALQGSQNYGLDIYTEEYTSDIDSKAIILPSFRDFCNSKAPISYTKILENNEHIDIKDIRAMFEMFRKENISYIELLYTKYIIINPKYKKIIQPIFDYRDDIVNINKNQFLRCIAGMSLEKVKALCHPYPGLIDKINKYGFDGKQLSHCARLNEFIKRYTKGEPIENCYITQKTEELINLKKNLKIDGKGFLDVEHAKLMCAQYDKETKVIQKENMTEQDIINQKGIDILNNIKYEILRQRFKEEL